MSCAPRAGVVGRVLTVRRTDKKQTAEDKVRRVEELLSKDTQ